MGGFRRYLGWILALSLLGTTADLALEGHYKALDQLIPLVLLALGLIAIVWMAVVRSRASVRTLQAVMAMFLVSGALGVALHVRTKMGFQKESNPSLGGVELVRLAIVRGTTPPVLAPAAMGQLGLLGLIFAYQFPLKNRVGKNESE